MARGTISSDSRAVCEASQVRFRLLVLQYCVVASRNLVGDGGVVCLVPEWFPAKSKSKSSVNLCFVQKRVLLVMLTSILSATSRVHCSLDRVENLFRKLRCPVPHSCRALVGSLPGHCHTDSPVDRRRRRACPKRRGGLLLRGAT